MSMVHCAISSSTALLPTTTADIEFTGNHVNSYAALVQFLDKLLTMHKFISLLHKDLAFVSSQVHNDALRIHVMEHMRPLQNGLMSDARTFQQCTILTWNPFYHVLSHFLVLSTSPHNEKVKVEMGKLLLDHCHEVGLIVGEEYWTIHERTVCCQFMGSFGG